MRDAIDASLIVGGLLVLSCYALRPCVSGHGVQKHGRDGDDKNTELLAGISRQSREHRTSVLQI